MVSSQIRVRFAPSPTGSLHIGGVRTALFNFLFARQSSGQFLLRIEDTDRERSSTQYEEEILESLKWLGLVWDGNITRQSDRLPVYQKHADELVSRGLAYRSEGSVKFRIPKQKVHFTDLVFGEMEFDSAPFEDFVLVKSNGFPAYNFACVIDDHDLEISHVIRGGDHLSNTPRQALLYEALGWSLPLFAHLPLVLGSDGEPLSKRHGEVNLIYYRNEGYIPAGILNYIALLGWSSGTNREFFPVSDLIREFSIKKVSKANAAFDIEKMKWLNGEHLKYLSDEEFITLSKGYLKGKGMLPPTLPENTIDQIILLYKKRIRILNDFNDQAGFFFRDSIVFDPGAVREHLSDGKKVERLRCLAERLANLSGFEDETKLESCLRALASELGIEAREIVHPARVALTGRSVSPSLFTVMRLLGRDLTLQRLRDSAHGFQPGE